MYHCAQSSGRHHRPSKSAAKGKERDKGSMDVFECAGWLHITLSDLSDIASVRLEHKDDHVHYCLVGIPSDVEDFVHAHSDLTLTQVRISSSPGDGL
jgi:hypothetical protein